MGGRTAGHDEPPQRWGLGEARFDGERDALLIKLACHIIALGCGGLSILILPLATSG